MFGSKMKFCRYCQREVLPIKRGGGTNWMKALVLILVTGGLALLFYIPYWVFTGLFDFSGKHCPICNAKL